MDVTIETNLTFYCTTSLPTTGAAADADSAPTYRIYEEETGTPVATGTMALLDASNTDGFYSEQVAVGTPTYTVDKFYCVRIAGTVGSIAAHGAQSFRVVAA